MFTCSAGRAFRVRFGPNSSSASCFLLVVVRRELSVYVRSYAKPGCRFTDSKFRPPRSLSIGAVGFVGATTSVGERRPPGVRNSIGAMVPGAFISAGLADGGGIGSMGLAVGAGKGSGSCAGVGVFVGSS